MDYVARDAELDSPPVQAKADCNYARSGTSDLRVR